MRPPTMLESAMRDVDVDGLVREAQNGSETAFDRLVTTFNGFIYNIAYRMAGNASDAEELTQEVFVLLFRSIRKFRRQSKFSTWLYALAVNSIRSGLRKIRRVASRETVRLDRRDENGRPCREAVDRRENPGEDLMRAEVRAQIEQAIANLAPDYRAAIVLRDLQGLAYEEIAAALGCTIGTVKSRLARARMRVKAELMEEGLVP